MKVLIVKTHDTSRHTAQQSYLAQNWDVNLLSHKIREWFDE